ncbi:MAG: NAD-dependent succinate-semialdehyde dehydrogenase [Desulfobacterales bacterium]|nr:MAG: NAD-dependent succinate-semialdehyde dehydrogenase [Desulfobacterales bacterium]
MADYLMLIDGEWVDAESREYIDVINPANEETFARVPRATATDVNRALEAAQRAFPAWARLSPARRADYLRRASAILEERKAHVGRLMTQEQGKPLKEAMGEVEKAAEMLQYYAEEGQRAYGTIIANPDPRDQSLVIKQPVGVVAALSPWNYPVELTGWKAAAALAAGCTIVAKPPSLTPLSPLEFWRCLFDAGIPAGVINAVTGSGETVGRQLVRSPISQKIAFTGSLEVGKDVQAQAKDMIKKISLELGGQCPLIVSKNCDLGNVVKGAVRRSFRNMGQICIAINRIYVHQDIYAAFLDAFQKQTRQLTIGNGLEKPDCDVGPMASLAGLEKSKRHIQDALAKGARLICGGKKPSGPEFQKGYFFEPTVLADTHHEMLVMTEETFGPVVGVMPFRTLQEAIAWANATPYGLAAYAYTNDLHEMDKLSRELEAGSVAINNVDAGIMNAPYGGWKQSGIGHEHGHAGLEEYLHLKHIRIRYREPEL